jgi:hypothetical protein
MFDVQLPDVEAVCGLDDAGLVDVMRDAARVESAAVARKLAALAELYQRRLAEQDAEDREQWCIDGVGAGGRRSRSRTGDQPRTGGWPVAVRIGAVGTISTTPCRGRWARPIRQTSSCSAGFTTDWLKNTLTLWAMPARSFFYGQVSSYGSTSQCRRRGSECE